MVKLVENVLIRGEEKSLVDILKSNGKVGSTQKTYTSLLNCYLKDLDNGRNMDIFYNNPTATVDDISKRYNPSKAKTLVSAILATINDTSSNTAVVYKNYIKKIRDDITQEEIKQEPTEKQLNNWVTQEDIAEIYNRLENCANNSFEDYQNYLILSLYTLIAPRRLLDYCDMVFYEPKEDEGLYNYINWKNHTFVFNVYKTKKVWNKQIIDIPSKLFTILNTWKDMNKDNMVSDELPLSLLINKDGNKLEPPTLNKRLNNIFGGKNISCNILRHSYISNFLKDTPKLLKLEQVARSMGHSTSTQQLYRKTI